MSASFLVLRVLFKKSMSFTDELSNLLVRYSLHAILKFCSLAALVSITQNELLARSLGARNSYLWSLHHCRISLHPCTTNSLQHWILLIMSDVAFTCIGSTFSYPHKEFLHPLLLRTTYNPRPAHDSPGQCLPDHWKGLRGCYAR